MDAPMAASNQGLSPFILEDARSRLLPYEDSQTRFFFSEETRSRFGHARSQANAPCTTSHVITLLGDEQHAQPNAMASALPADEDSLIILDTCPSSHTIASAGLMPEHAPQSGVNPLRHDDPATTGPGYVNNELTDAMVMPQTSAMPHPQVTYGAAVAMGTAALRASVPPQSPYLLQFTASQAAQAHQAAAQPPPPPQNP
jgi:hypothetical protein